jgi:co-chaperonin GroES (HSP10)
MIRPLGDRILVEMAESIHDTFLIPLDVSKWRGKDNAIEGYNRGKVLRVGPGKRHEKTGALMPVTVKPGDMIRFSELQYWEGQEDGKRVCLIHEGDILGVEEQ